MSKTRLPGILVQIEAEQQRQNEKVSYAVVGTVIAAVGVGLAVSLPAGLIAVGVGFIVAAVIR